jgi:hypothetical protein
MRTRRPPSLLCRASHYVHDEEPPGWSRRPFEDPSRVEGLEEERLALFRSVRDRIRERIEDDLVATDEVMPTS